MCKVMIFSNFSKVKAENVKTRVEFIGNMLSKTERDGFGYAIQGEKGIFGERTTNNYFYSHQFSKIKPLIKKFVYTDDQETFGDVSPIKGGAMFHGRVSTNSPGLLNTHPINKHGWSLIHNGVVTHMGEEYDMITDNDTEHVLENLVQGGIKQVADNLTGYYVFGALDPEGNLHIARDRIADLFCSYIPAMESFVFATTRILIEAFCEKFNYDHSPIQEFVHDTYVVFDKTGKIIKEEEFDSQGFVTKYESDMSWLSLGRPLTQAQSSTLSSYSKYLDECKKVDATYSFYDGRTGDQISLIEFKKMKEDDWFLVDVVRADGTIVDYIEYDKKVKYSELEK